MAKEISFSKASLASLPVPQERVYYRDGSTRGLLVVCHPTGTRAFEVYRKVAGRPVRVALGHFNAALPDSREITSGIDPLSLLGNAPELNVKQARTLARAVNAQLDKGINPAVMKRKARQAIEGELTLRGAFNRYEKDWLLPHGKRSAGELVQMFERNLGAISQISKKPRGKKRTKNPNGVNWENKTLAAISATDIRRLLVALKDGRGPHTANRVFELLRAIYRKTAEWKLYQGENPCDGIPMFKEESRARFLTADELPRFFKQLHKEKDQLFKDFVFLSLLTGARRANVLGMQWGQLQLDAGLWTVPGAQSKSGVSLTIPLTKTATEILEKRKAARGESAFVFPANSASGHMTAPKKRWGAFLKSAKLEGLRFHDLRRSMGSWAAMTGASLPIIGMALGHKSAEATQVYARLQSDPVREAMEKAVGAMLSKAGASGNVIRLQAAKLRKGG